MSITVSAQEILWLRPDFPPATFVRGPLKDQGYNDLSRQFIVKRLPHYKHLLVEAGYERIVLFMREHNACMVGLYKSPEREVDLVYSVPRMLVLSNGLIVRTRDLEHFSPYMKDDSIDLFALSRDPALIGGAADGRLYKGSIDQVIKQHRSDPNMLMRSGQDVFKGLLKMLDKGRIDYTFGFPVELTFQQHSGELQQSMTYLAVEGMPPAIPSYVACSRNNWGQEVIQQIDQILLANRSSDEFLGFYQSWLDESSKRYHRKVTLENFGLH
ncbi:TIGR02285 family protein [Aliiglaciecola sp. CAU 1673]|uniref:TIGR02285 family protein n=1 Tax=Aliiglaciecola sp. CAU 1673 TaxID=3032595 RepID=UPI0023DBBC89|nr:TIGR02285 family protein [Aliiglaciecola sp. CAU 1673]MDF2176832.1 TIGR02285 family protein [Aliiglaciecola sp. CAU 1673]